MLGYPTHGILSVLFDRPIMMVDSNRVAISCDAFRRRENPMGNVVLSRLLSGKVSFTTSFRARTRGQNEGLKRNHRVRKTGGVKSRTKIYCYLSV